MSTKYRDMLREEYGEDIGSVVGCGIDRVFQETQTEIHQNEILNVIQFYTEHEKKIKELNLSGRRDAIRDYIVSGYSVPSYINE